jgi:hypothetical protein
VFVNTSHASQPVIYQPNDLLGFTADATHSIHLFVDGTPSNAGPALGIDTLDYAANPYPSCIAEKYGTGHKILLTYSSGSAGALGVHSAPRHLATGDADPGANGLLFDSPMPHLGFGAADRTAWAKLSLGSLSWLVGRHAA